MNLGKVGIFTSYRRIGEDNGPEAAQLAEELGFGTFWLGGSPAVGELRPLLEPTDRITVASGILNVWQHDPADVAADWAQLSSAFPGRALLGIDQKTLAGLAGVSLPTIQRMEASTGTVRGVVETLIKVVDAFNRAGVELIGEHARSDDGGRGVRLKQPGPPRRVSG